MKSFKTDIAIKLKGQGWKRFFRASNIHNTRIMYAMENETGTRQDVEQRELSKR